MADYPQKSLADRFREFMAQYPGVERIDDLAPGGNGKRADYLLDNRSVILELKSLETDVRPKIDRMVEALSAREDWPLFYGSVQLLVGSSYGPRRFATTYPSAIARAAAGGRQ